MNEDDQRDFAEIAEEDQSESIVAEFIEFLGSNKKWWLAPIMIVLMLMGLVVLFSSSAAAPFIYTLF